MSNLFLARFSAIFLPVGEKSDMVGHEEFMYTGKPYDSATGLYYIWARYYDPTTGRFITEDSVVGSTSEPDEPEPLHVRKGQPHEDRRRERARVVGPCGGPDYGCHRRMGSGHSRGRFLLSWSGDYEAKSWNTPPRQQRR
ncbi:MAG: hypothetical protein JRN21_02475 [Nitrososphaerota archaeon]|nr:hypothetical protein [Nitrososphaerota archaeon]